MNKKTLSEIYIIIAAALWGMIGISVTALTGMGLSRMDVVFIRSFTALVALGIYLLITDRSAFRLKPKDVWCFLGTGIISLMIFNICYFSAMEYTSLGVAAVLLYTAPAFVVIISAFVFKEKVTFTKVASLVMMFVGCMFVTGIFDEEAKLSVLGILFGLGSGLGYAMYSIFSRFAINRGYCGVTISFFYTFAFASLASAFLADFNPVYLICNAQTLFYSLFIGVVCCTFPYILYTKGMEHTENGKASTLAMIEPLVATVIGISFFGDELTLWKAVGIAIMFAAIGFINLKK